MPDTEEQTGGAVEPAAPRTGACRWRQVAVGVGRGLAALGIVVVFLAVWVDPSVFYEDGPYFPPFQYGGGFFRSFVMVPGGLAEYAAARLAQVCVDRWPGAVCLGVLALWLGLAHAFYGRAAGRVPWEWGGVPALLALLIWAAYGFRLASILALTLALTVAAGYAHMWVDGLLLARTRAALGVLALAACYWVCGGAALLCLLLCAAVDHGRRRQPRAAATILVGGVVAMLLPGVVVGGLGTQDALTHLLPGTSVFETRAFELLCLLYISPLMTAFAVFRPRDPAATSDDRQALWRRATTRLGLNRWPHIARPVLAIAVAVGVLCWGHSPVLGRQMTIRKLARSRRWEDLLDTATQLRLSQFAVGTSYAVNQALFYTGQLGDRLFLFPQVPGSLTLGAAFGDCASPGAFMGRPDLFFDLGEIELEMGMVNESEQLAHEALEIHGPHPTILRRLALVNLVKNRPATARVFLVALTRDPAARGWGAEQIAILDTDPERLTQHETIQHLRRMAQSAHDRHDPIVPLERRCLHLLGDHPDARIAFEYLMAHYLITKNLKAMMLELTRYHQVGYTRLPIHYQEAIVMQEHRTGISVPGLSPLVAPEVRQGFETFMARLTPHMRDSSQAAAMAATVPFRATYFYYFVFT